MLPFIINQSLLFFNKDTQGLCEILQEQSTQIGVKKDERQNHEKEK